MIRDNVKCIREAKGVSKSHIAEKLGLTPQGYWHIEEGKSRLLAESLKVIAGVLEEDISVFFDQGLTDLVLDRIRGC